MGIIGLLGVVLFLAGVIWLIVISIQTGETTGEKVLWAVVNFICQPLGGIIFYIVRRQGLIPLILVIIGWLLLMYGNYGMMSGMMNQPPY
ncbi:MAG TPA: hypothetical protein VK892_16230 [Pyrinomonadaceae bacterium]|nr:hypothetical protein [Pyrinomonadaceae bacterium]